MIISRASVQDRWKRSTSRVTKLCSERELLKFRLPQGGQASSPASKSNRSPKRAELPKLTKDSRLIKSQSLAWPVKLEPTSRDPDDVLGTNPNNLRVRW